MNKCLYTYVGLNQNRPPDDNTETLEHIVPYALGGSTAFSIQYCSKKANNDYGRDIDAPFVALPLIGFKRHELGLTSYSNKVPDIVFDSDCADLNKKCKLVIPYQGKLYADFGIEVIGGLDSSNMSFSGSEDRLRMAVNNLINKAPKKGLDVLNLKLQSISDFDDALETATVSSGKTLHFRMGFGYDNFFVPWSRGLVKLALGLGAFALGKSWTFSPAADVLRSALVCDVADLENGALRGTTVGKLSNQLVQMIDIKADRHTLAVLPNGNRMAAVISLFGGQLLDAIIDLGDGPADVKVVNEELPTDWDCVFHIEPKTRNFSTMSLGELNSRVP